MIEQVMIFALGFLAASLLALLCLPVVSRRAVRLATRRLSMLVPLSLTEIVAERDQIRAEHAVAARRQEQKIEALTRDKAEAMGEAGRHATRVYILERQGVALASDNAELRAGLETATRAANEAQAELGLQTQLLHDALGIAERRLAILNATQASLAASEATVNEQRDRIDGLEGRSTKQDFRLRSLMSRNLAAAADLKDLRAGAAGVMVDLGTARAEIALLEAKRDGLQADLEAARDAILAGEQHYAAQAEQMAGLAGRLAAQGADLAILQRSLSDAQSRRDALAGERDRLADRLVKVESEIAMRPAASTPGPDDDLALLRHTIATLAADVLRVSQERAESRRGPDLASGAGGAADPAREDVSPV